MSEPVQLATDEQGIHLVMGLRHEATDDQVEWWDVRCSIGCNWHCDVEGQENVAKLRAEGHISVAAIKRKELVGKTAKVEAKQAELLGRPPAPRLF